MAIPIPVIVTMPVFTGTAIAVIPAVFMTIAWSIVVVMSVVTMIV
jgi:hypothetical protein